MMEFSERVLVLQVGKFREADLWVRFLSPTRGLLSAFAFGGSRSRRRFVGCLDTFNEIHVKAHSTRRGAYLALQEGVLIRGLSRLRRDWPRFGLANNCARFLQSFGVAREGADIAHQLMLQTLHLLEERERIPRLLSLFFRVRLAFDHGYALYGDRCRSCGRALMQEGAFFFLHEGLIMCRRCAAASPGQGVFLNPEVLTGLESLRLLPPEQWEALELSPASSRDFARAMDGFIQHHVGIAWERGRFIRQ